MLGAAQRQKDVGKPEAYKDASLSQNTESSFGGLTVTCRCPCPGIAEESMGWAIYRASSGTLW